jgi:hypothetical protein
VHNKYVIIDKERKIIMFDVVFYQDKNGNEPIKEYIYELARKGLTSKPSAI